MVVNGDGKVFFGIVLTNDIFIEKLLDFLRLGQILLFQVKSVLILFGIFLVNFGHHFPGTTCTITADVTRCSGNEQFYLISVPATETTFIGLFGHAYLFLIMTSSIMPYSLASIAVIQ